MKFLRLFVATLVIFIASNALAQKVTVDQISASPNSEANLVISLTGSSEVAKGAEFHIYLPTGVDIKSEDGDYSYELGDIIPSNEFVNIAKTPSGYVEVTLFSTKLKPFKSENGKVITLPLVIGNLAEGQYKGSIKEIKFAISSTQVIKGSDANGYLPEVEYSITVKNPTAIKNVTVDKSAKKAGIYTISGQKLNKITESGVYIVDGKKVAVKK